MRGATAPPSWIDTGCLISIHTPHAGSDLSCWNATLRLRLISIHTPHAGSDGCSGCPKSPAPNFNPHSPCGERLVLLERNSAIASYFNPHSPCGERRVFRSMPDTLHIFQSTLPMRGATVCAYYGKKYVVISIHTPHAGSDGCNWFNHSARNNFNPHSPCGERRCCTTQRGIDSVFQSTLPMRGATAIHDCQGDWIPISIHTPHAGSDMALAAEVRQLQQFQSTLPMRGATTYMDCFNHRITNFNPHSPCGERRF